MFSVYSTEIHQLPLPLCVPANENKIEMCISQWPLSQEDGQQSQIIHNNNPTKNFHSYKFWCGRRRAIFVYCIVLCFVLWFRQWNESFTHNAKNENIGDKRHLPTFMNMKHNVTSKTWKVSRFSSIIYNWIGNGILQAWASSSQIISIRQYSGEQRAAVIYTI